MPGRWLSGSSCTARAKIDRRTFSKCIAFEDISYQLAQPETRTAIFEHLCDLYNYVDASIHVQLSFLNRKVDPVQYAKSFEIAPQGDDFDDIRAEYTAILQKQLASGNNGIVKTKYLTFTIEADNLKTARARLTRIGLDLLGYFKTMGCVAHVMDGQARLEVLHGIFHPDGEPFRFDWDWLAPSGLSTKDFVAPSSLCFGTAKTFGLGGKYGAVSFLQILAPELSDEMLADFLKTESGILVNLHVQAIDQTETIKTIKRKITDLDAMKIQEQKKAVRSGYDMDILPSDLATYGEDAKKLLNKLQTRNERLFMLTFLVLNVADTKQKLGNDVFQAAGVAQKYNCSLVRLDYQQEQGLVSSLPLGINQIKIQRSLTTSNVAVFVPFVTQELFQSGAAMYYGINAKSHNMIMLDRKQARCPNGLKLGTPGSGKSMSCKSEIVSVFLTTADDIFISDPEAEYYPLVKRLHGQVIKLSPTSKDYVNPLDINLNYSEDDSPLALKSDFVLSFCELVMGGKTGLEAIERTVIDRAVKAIYRPYLASPCPENMPAFASGSDPAPEPLPEIIEEEPTTGGMEPEGVPITPKGNATLVDDFYGDKQLITVTTKAGNYFYILIDRANEDKETSVHFLNQVDDADLLALLDEEPQAAEVCTCTVKCEAGNVNENCPLCEKSLRNCTAPEAVKTDTETPQEKPKSNMGSLIILLVLALAGGGAALYYFKFRKSKADTTGHDDLDEYDFGEDEDADEEPAEIEIHSEDGQEDET